MTYTYIETEIADGIAQLKFNRPALTRPVSFVPVGDCT